MKHAKEKAAAVQPVAGVKGLHIKPYWSLELPAEAVKETYRVDHVILFIEPGAEDRYHYHDATYDLFTLVSGDVNAVVNDKDIPLDLKDSLLVEPGDRHKLRNVGDKKAVVVETRLGVVEGDKKFV